MKSSQKLTLNRGFSVLEVLIALAILTLGISAAILIVFGNQSLKIDNETNGEALYKAKSLLERARASSTLDFISINTTATTSEDIYSKKFNVADVSPCAKDLTSVVNWLSSFRPLEIQLTTRVTSLDEAEKLGGFCDPVAPESAWDTPRTYGGISPSFFAGQGTGVAGMYINGIRYMFVTTDTASGDNFYSIDTSNPNSISSSNIFSTHVENGLYVVTTAEIAGHQYAFVLTGHNKFGQLQVIDISTPTSPTLITSASTTIPNVTTNEDAVARSIFFYQNKIYIGTDYLAFGPSGFNHELHVFNVSDPLNPQPEYSINVGRRVNNIVVRDSVAYLATGPGGSPYTPLKIFDLSSKQLVGEFVVPDNRFGMSLFLLGNRLYFGLERTTTGNDFYVLDVSNSTPVQLSASSLGQNSTQVGDIVVQTPYAFIGLLGAGSHHSFQIWNVSDPEAPFRINNCTVPFPQNLTGLIYAEDLIFASFRSNIVFQIIYDDPNLSCP